MKNTDKKIDEKPDYEGIVFLVQEKDISKIEVKDSICINVFGYKNKLVFPIYVFRSKISRHNGFVAINHIMCRSKILTDLWFTKQKIKPKNGFCKSCL